MSYPQDMHRKPLLIWNNRSTSGGYDLVLAFAELHFGIDPMQVAQILQIHMVKSQVLKCCFHFSVFLLKKSGRTKIPPASLTSRTLDVGGETPSLTSRT